VTARSSALRPSQATSRNTSRSPSGRVANAAPSEAGQVEPGEPAMLARRDHFEEIAPAA
jgi:hypothetical protein